MPSKKCFVLETVILEVEIVSAMEVLTQIACVSGAGAGAGIDTHYSRCNQNNDRGSLKKEKVVIKKKLKLLKGLSKDLSTFSDMGFASLDQNNHNLLLQVRGKMIMEAAEVLLKQLEQLKAEEKELKRIRKQEKAKLKAQNSCESSKEEKEVMHVKRLTSEPGIFEEHKQANDIEEKASSSSPLSSLSSNCCSEAITKRIEVCMGNKCKKLGGEALLEEFQRVVGGVEEGGRVAVGCKCMGKCRDGPNVRLFSSDNPLCIGVGLEDVSDIVTQYFAQHTQQLGLNPAF